MSDDKESLILFTRKIKEEIDFVKILVEYIQNNIENSKNSLVAENRLEDLKNVRKVLNECRNLFGFIRLFYYNLERLYEKTNYKEEDFEHLSHEFYPIISEFREVFELDYISMDREILPRFQSEYFTRISNRRG